MDITIQPSGGDDAPALQALFNGASDGDTLVLQPKGGQPFKIGTPLDWTAPKSKTIHVNARGATLEAINGCSPMVTFGATAGQRGQGFWDGGFLWGPVTLQNWGSADFCPDVIYGHGLTIALDTVSSYWLISVRGGINSGSDPAIRVVQKVPTAWANQNTIWKTPLTAPVLIQCDYHGPAPSGWEFERCSIEGNGVLQNTGPFGVIYNRCYFEGTWQRGASLAANIEMRQCTGNRPVDQYMIVED
jgi:hypothetical protein